MEKKSVDFRPTPESIFDSLQKIADHVDRTTRKFIGDIFLKQISLSHIIVRRYI